MSEFLIIGLLVLALFVIAFLHMVCSDLEDRRAARKVEDEPFVGRYRIIPIVGGYRIERYQSSWFDARKGYMPIAEVQGSIEDARATVEHLSQPVEVIR